MEHIVYGIKRGISGVYYIKNKTSKIKSVCDGERKLAYGYHWEYCENL